MSMSKFSTFTNVDYPLTPKVPEHWRALPCRAFVAEKVEKNNDGIEREYLSLMSNVGVIRYSEKGDVGNKAPDDLTKCKVVEKGNLVINSMNYSIGSYGISLYDGVCSPVYIVLEPITSVVLRRFALRIFENKEFQNWAQSFGSGILAHRAAIGWDDLKNIIVGIPPLGEQQKIAQFLDYETAKIDALIDEQKRLIELLKEKRQAVISHAVTKGLNPDAPMKDSGIEWLGEVPKHWVISRIKNFANIESGHTPSKKFDEYWENADIPWVSLNDSKQLKRVDYIDATAFKISELGVANSSARLLPEKAVVFTRDASIGLAAITTKKMAVSQHLIAWLCLDSKLIPEYLLLIFYAMEKEFERYTFGATIKTIGLNDVHSLTAAFPNIEEQKEIVSWAFTKKQIIEQGLINIEKNISLLKERRSALISAAVTGKIDVRDWQPPAGSDTVDSNALVQTERHYG